MNILAIDPGKNGAIAVSTHHRIPGLELVYSQVYGAWIGCRPFKGQPLSILPIVRGIRRWGSTVAVLERVWAMPSQGVVSMFSFGEAYGQVQGILYALDVDVRYVTAREWKSALGLTGTGKKSSDWKSPLVAMIRKQLPNLVDGHNVSDSSLDSLGILLYGLNVLPSSA